MYVESGGDEEDIAGEGKEARSGRWKRKKSGGSQTRRRKRWNMEVAEEGGKERRDMAQ